MPTEILNIDTSTNPNKDSKVLINNNGAFNQVEIDVLLEKSDTIPAIKNSLTDTINGDIFDGITLDNGGINTTSGNDDTTANLKRTKHINAIPSSQFTLSGLSQAIRLFEYADDKSYIKTTVVNNGTFTLGSTTKYIRFHGGSEIFVLPTVKCVGLMPCIRAVNDVKNTLSDVSTSSVTAVHSNISITEQFTMHIGRLVLTNIVFKVSTSEIPAWTDILKPTFLPNGNLEFEMYNPAKPTEIYKAFKINNNFQTRVALPTGNYQCVLQYFN